MSSVRIPPRSDRSLLAMLIAAIMFVSAFAASAVVRSGSGSWLRGEADAVGVEPDATPRFSPEPNAVQPIAVEPIVATGIGYTTSVGDPSPVPTFAAEGRPGISDGQAEIQQTSRGTACRSTAMPSEYGSYPLARCRMWHRSKGLLSGETLAKGGTTVTCQRDLDRPNPQYRTGQFNTWWVWTTSDTGTWDWFPQTAVAEGVSGQPINGIALCRDSK
jgi:hypothetical protein